MDILGVAADNFGTWWASTPVTEKAWLVIGFAAQALFAKRFIIQWVASERAKRAIVPDMFLYLSFTGGLLLFAYAIYRGDPVFMLGQGTGLLIYARNIQFVWQVKRELAAAAAKQPAE